MERLTEGRAGPAPAAVQHGAPSWPSYNRRPVRADRLQPLRDALGDELPAGVDALSDDELADLVAALRAADGEQSAALDDAIGHTLRFLPWPLNGIVKRILVG